jgi:hypothetical protein
MGTSGEKKLRRRPGRQFGDAKVREKRHVGWRAASVAFQVVAFGGFEGDQEDGGDEDGGDDPSKARSADVGGEGGAAFEGRIVELGEEEEASRHGNPCVKRPK